MEGFQALVSWFKKPSKQIKTSAKKKSKSTMKLSILYPGHIGHDSNHNRPPTKACLCRASMTLPPTPRDISRDSTRLVWGRSCIDSPAHVYEEIPAACTGSCAHYCDVKTCPQSGCVVIKKALKKQKAAEEKKQSQQVTKSEPEQDEYLAPTTEVTAKSQFSFGDKFEKVLRLADGSLCKYDKISPLSALGLTFSNLKKCQRCQRPHGVYNGTVYRHGSNSSPDLVNLEWHCFRPKSKAPPLPSEAPPTSQATPPPTQAPPLMVSRGHYHSIGDLRSPSLWGQEQDGGKASGKSAFSAFQVLKPAEHQRLADLTSREFHAADAIKNSGEYAYYLSKVKHNFNLEQEVQRTQTPPGKKDKTKTKQNQEMGDNRPIARVRKGHVHSHDPSVQKLPPSGKRVNHGSKSMTNLYRFTKSELDSDFGPNGVKSFDTQMKFNTLQQRKVGKKYGAYSESVSTLSDAAMDRLSCRATNFSLTPGNKGRHGNKRYSYSEYKSSVDERHGGRSYHNPLLSDIMMRNHDRQNLVV